MAIDPNEMDATHISDSVNKATQSNSSDQLAQSLGLGNAQPRLRKLLQEAQDRAEQLHKDLGDLQYRYEEQREKSFQRKAQRDSATRKAQQATAKLTETEEILTAVRAECKKLKQQLEDAQLQLRNHSVPERAELEELKLKLGLAQAEAEKTQKRLNSTNQDLGYFQSEYQSASSSAKTFATQVTELENQLAFAQNKATGKHAKLRQMGYDAQTHSLRDENKKLKALLEDREAGLKFRDEEIAKLKEAQRGRMGTRGTSVPRSPRLGSPMKLDARKGTASRQESPSVGELKGKASHLHPLRNG